MWTLKGFWAKLVCQNFKTEVCSTEKLTSISPFMPHRIRCIYFSGTPELSIGLGLLSEGKNALKERPRVQRLQGWECTHTSARVLSNYRYATCIFTSGKVFEAPFFLFFVTHRSPESVGSWRCEAGGDGKLWDALKDEEESSLNSAGLAPVREGWGVVFWFGFVCFRKSLTF